MVTRNHRSTKSTKIETKNGKSKIPLKEIIKIKNNIYENIANYKIENELQSKTSETQKKMKKYIWKSVQRQIKQKHPSKSQ